MTVEELQVIITANTAGLTTAMSGVTSQMNTMQQQATAAGAGIGRALGNAGAKMKSVGDKLAIGVTTPIIGLGVAAAKLASDLNESLNKIDVAFGKDANKVKAWSNTTLKSFGIAKGTALDMASNYGDMATSMGLPTGAASVMSEKLVGLAGDLSSFKNIGISEANTALTAIFTGETESLKSLGIVMTQVNLQDFAASKGIKTKIADMSEQEKVQLRYNFVLEKTKNAQGDFARTGAGTANSARVFKESLKELGEIMGQNILPVITPIIQKMSEMVQAFGKLSPAAQQTIIKIAAIAAVVGPVLIVIGTLSTAVGAIAGVFASASTAIAGAGGMIAILTGPIGIAIIAIGALIAIGVLLYKNWNTVKAVTIAVWNSIKTFFSSVWNSIKNTVSSAVNGIKSTITSVWNSIKSTTSSVFNGVKTAIMTPINSAVSLVRSGVNKIKGFFSGMHISFPKIPLPHFPNIVGKFSLSPPSMPHLDGGIRWYQNGGVFNKPTKIGIAENGEEAVVPLERNLGWVDKMASKITDKMGNGGNGLNLTITNFANNRSQDVQSLAEELQFYMNQKQMGGSR